MKRFMPNLVIIAAIIALGAKAYNNGTLFSDNSRSNVTEYIENETNKELGSDVESAAEYAKGFLKVIADIIQEGGFSSSDTETESNIDSLVSDNTIESLFSDTELEEVELVYVIDGDTLLVIGEDGLQYKVRLIGIDTPESVNADESKNNQYGEMASDHTKELLKDVTTLYLEYDELTTDVYNRTLAYVWLSSDTSNTGNMLNARILYDGYAIDKVYEPNDKYADDFSIIRNDAEENERGLWSNYGYKTLIYGEE